MKVISD